MPLPINDDQKSIDGDGKLELYTASRVESNSGGGQL